MGGGVVNGKTEWENACAAAREPLSAEEEARRARLRTCLKCYGWSEGDACGFCGMPNAALGTCPTPSERKAQLAEYQRCSCCHEMVRWSDLKLVGIQQVDDEPSLELRNHECGSTLARQVAA